MLVLAGGAQLRPARLQPLRVQRSALPSLPARPHGVAPRARHVVARKRTLLVQVRAREPPPCRDNASARQCPKCCCVLPQAISAPERPTVTPGMSSNNGNGNGAVALMKMGSGPSELGTVAAMVAAESDAAFGDAAMAADSANDWSRFKGYSTFKARFGWLQGWRLSAAPRVSRGLLDPSASCGALMRPLRGAPLAAHLRNLELRLQVRAQAPRTEPEVDVRLRGRLLGGEEEGAPGGTGRVAARGPPAPRPHLHQGMPPARARLARQRCVG